MYEVAKKFITLKTVIDLFCVSKLTRLSLTVTNVTFVTSF